MKQEEVIQCPLKDMESKEEVVIEEDQDVKEEKTGFVMYKGSVLDISSVMMRLERSERTRNEMEKQMQTLTTQKGRILLQHWDLVHINISVLLINQVLYHIVNKVGNFI